MKILIADDDEVFRRLLVALLGSWGHEVATASDGEEAFRALSAPDGPRLALLDWKMPHLDGVSLCRRLRQDVAERCLYLIMMSGRAHPSDLAAGLEAGADDYLRKPIDDVELRARVGVGMRVLGLADAHRTRMRLQGAVEMAGAVCHELNQPLQVLTGWSELLASELGAEDPRAPVAARIAEAAFAAGALTARLSSLTRYAAKDYMAGAGRIIDLHESTSPPDGSTE